MARATKGGTVGMNGEFYKGGEFLPNTTMPKGVKANKSVNTGKQQIGRYTWAIAPNGEKSIYSAIVGTVAQEKNGKLYRFEPAIAYYGETVRGHAVDTLIEMYNNGEMWIVE